MNPIVEEFIERQKQKQNESRAEHLKSLGLVEFEKDAVKKYCANEYSDETAKSYGYIYTDEKGRFKYVGDSKAIEVTDAEYEEICKYCPVVKKDGFSEEMLEKVDSIRKMVKFFTILMIISLVLAFLSAIISIFMCFKYFVCFVYSAFLIIS